MPLVFIYGTKYFLVNFYRDPVLKLNCFCLYRFHISILLFSLLSLNHNIQISTEHLCLIIPQLPHTPHVQLTLPLYPHTLRKWHLCVLNCLNQGFSGWLDSPLSQILVDWSFSYLLGLPHRFTFDSFWITNKASLPGSTSNWVLLQHIFSIKVAIIYI